MVLDRPTAATHWFWRNSVTAGIVAMSIASAASQDRGPGRLAGQGTATPDYNRVFAMDRVHELRIQITTERFREMQADLVRFGSGRGGRAFGRGLPPAPPLDGLAEAAVLQEAVVACSGRAADGDCSIRGAAGRCARGFGDSLLCVSPKASPGVPPAFQVPEPIAVRVSVHSSGRTWTNVRMRYKGNSSLMAATSTGNGKVPFRLDFAPDGKADSRQSFYGFRKLTFSSNFADDSQLREVLATEVLRDRGVPAARAAFYRVVVDTGEGARYWGLYTMVEDPSDGAMLDAQLGGRGANLYKPDGPAATWTRFDPASFAKKTNEGELDFSDVIAAIDALHSDTTDRSAWRGRIERVFDVDLFLRWLAVNTAIGNWDAYGAMAHNYYLYGDPVRGGRLRWIPWDHNMAFGAGPGGRGFPGRGAFGAGRPFGAFPNDAADITAPDRPAFPRGFGRGRGGPFGGGMQDVLHRDVGAEWPLIARLLADPDYAARYRAFLSDAMAGLMAPEVMARRVRELHELIVPAITGPDGELKNHTTVGSEAAFRDSPSRLLAEIDRQRERIQAALAETTR